MEFKDYLRIIKKYKITFWFIWLVVIFLGFFTVAVQPDVYRGEKTLLLGREKDVNNDTVGKMKENQTDIFFQSQPNYDYYYQLEADKNVAIILVKSLTDKSLMKDVLLLNRETGARLSREDYWVLSKVKGEVLGAGYIKIIIKSHQRAKVEVISDKLVVKLAELIDQIGFNNEQKVRVVSAPIEVGLQKKPYLPVGLGVFFGGLLLAIVITLGKYYLDNEK